MAQNQRKEAKAAEKAKRKSGREADAAARAAVEAEWKVIVAEHAKAVVDWQKECEVLKANGTRVKDLPKKPKRPLKPKPTLQSANPLPEGGTEADGGSESSLSDSE